MDSSRRENDGQEDLEEASTSVGSRQAQLEGVLRVYSQAAGVIHRMREVAMHGANAIELKCLSRQLRVLLLVEDHLFEPLIKGLFSSLKALLSQLLSIISDEPLNDWNSRGERAQLTDGDSALANLLIVIGRAGQGLATELTSIQGLLLGTLRVLCQQEQLRASSSQLLAARSSLVQLLSRYPMEPQLFGEFLELALVGSQATELPVVLAEECMLTQVLRIIECGISNQKCYQQLARVKLRVVCTLVAVCLTSKLADTDPGSFATLSMDCCRQRRGRLPKVAALELLNSFIATIEGVYQYLVTLLLEIYRCASSKLLRQEGGSTAPCRCQPHYSVKLLHEMCAYQQMGQCLLVMAAVHDTYLRRDMSHFTRTASEQLLYCPLQFSLESTMMSRYVLYFSINTDLQVLNTLLQVAGSSQVVRHQFKCTLLELLSQHKAHSEQSEEKSERMENYWNAPTIQQLQNRQLIQSKLQKTALLIRHIGTGLLATQLYDEALASELLTNWLDVSSVQDVVWQVAIQLYKKMQQLLNSQDSHTSIDKLSGLLCLIFTRSLPSQHMQQRLASLPTRYAAFPSCRKCFISVAKAILSKSSNITELHIKLLEAMLAHNIQLVLEECYQYLALMLQLSIGQPSDSRKKKLQELLLGRLRDSQDSDMERVCDLLIAFDNHKEVYCRAFATLKMNDSSERSRNCRLNLTLYHLDRIYGFNDVDALKKLSRLIIRCKLELLHPRDQMTRLILLLKFLIRHENRFRETQLAALIKHLGDLLGVLDSPPQVARPPLSGLTFGLSGQRNYFKLLHKLRHNWGSHTGLKLDHLQPYFQKVLLVEGQPRHIVKIKRTDL